MIRLYADHIKFFKIEMQTIWSFCKQGLPHWVQATIGRLAVNSLTVEDNEVSGHHLVLQWQSEERCWQVGLPPALL